MKKVFKILILAFALFTLTGCTKELVAIPENKFISTFKDKKDYKLINNTNTSQGIFEKSYEMGNGNVSFYYLEFSSKKKANEYMKLSYDSKSFNYRKKANYIIAKKKLSKIYIKAIKVDNIIIIGMGNKFKDRFEVNKIFRNFNM